MSAAETYAARVDAVLEQRTRLRGPQPPGDLFGALPPGHPLLAIDVRRALEPNLEILASYVEPDDVIVDVGGGAGRYSLPLALRCREVVNVDPSAAFVAGFEANARNAGISNARAVQADWQGADLVRGSLVLLNHVLYLTADVVPFLQKLESAASRRVLITVNSPPPPSWNRELFRLLYGEVEKIVPGHVELVNVLWEMGIEPDIRMLPNPTSPFPAQPTRQAAVQHAIGRFGGDQWALWPLGDVLTARLRSVLETRFDELFEETPDGFAATWPVLGREVLITWEPRR
jgi:SAM-dependent methyltransferase